MRTTVTLDDDVAAAIERRRREHRTAFRDEINGLLRAGLIASEREAENHPEDYELPTFASGRQLIADPKLLREMLDEDDVERYRR